MRTKLCLVVLVVLLLGPVSAQALVCTYCDCTMDCTRACRNPETWEPSTCGAYGALCAQNPDCLYRAPESPLLPELERPEQAAVCAQPAARP